MIVSQGNLPVKNRKIEKALVTRAMNMEKQLRNRWMTATSGSN